MWDDLGDYVKKTVAAHHGCVREHYAVLEQAAADQAPDPQQTAEQATAVHAENRARVARTRQRYEQVQKLKGEGKRIAAITRELRLAPGTARRYFHADSADELVAASLAGWPSMLDDYKPHLHQRWNEGCTNIQQLHREVKALGFRGSYATVYAYLAPFQGKAAPPAVPGPPKVRHITSWIRRCPDNLDADEQLKLTQVRAACPAPGRPARSRRRIREDADRPPRGESRHMDRRRSRRRPTPPAQLRQRARARSPLCWPGLPCPTHLALSRAKSARSNSSRGSCSAGPATTC